MKAWEAAFAVMIETKNPSVMYGDEWLCHQIAAKLGWEHEGPLTSRRVLKALSRTPGRLVKGLCKMPADCCARGQAVLTFELPQPEYDQIAVKLGTQPDSASASA